MKSETKLSPIVTAEHCSGLSDDELKLMANTFGEKCQQAAKKTVEDAITAGTALLVMRERVAHGDWAKWLAANWDYTRQTAQTYLTLAVNVKRFTNRTPDSIREAMRVIADQEAEEIEPQITPRAERKTGRVEVIKADRPQAAQADENAVPPEPKTDTKHSSETAKAKEVDRPVPAMVTPEIVEEPKYDRQAWDDLPEPKTLADFAVTQIYEFLIESADDAKKRAKELRKVADKLDPPKKFSPPDVEEVAEYCRERKNTIDPEQFVAFYAQQKWKLANGNNMNDWKSAVITWEKRNDTGSKQAGRAIAGTGRIKPDAIDESAITWK